MYVSRKMKKNIKIAAENSKVQIAVLKAMFDGCEAGTDIWEYIDSADDIPSQINDLLYGPNCKDPETPEEEVRMMQENANFGAIYYGGHEAAVLLINAVKDNILKKL